MIFHKKKPANSNQNSVADPNYFDPDPAGIFLPTETCPPVFPLLYHTYRYQFKQS